MRKTGEEEDKGKEAGRVVREARGEAPHNRMVAEIVVALKVTLLVGGRELRKAQPTNSKRRAICCEFACVVAQTLDVGSWTPRVSRADWPSASASASTSPSPSPSAGRGPSCPWRPGFVRGSTDGLAVASL